MCKKGYIESGSSNFALKSSEVDCYEFDSSWIDILEERIKSKIGFIRGYLVDISFDGPVFMSKHSQFLTLQYPSRCENALGIWLEQDLQGDAESGGYFGYQGWDVSLFVNRISDVDMAAVRNILPFDSMWLRKPGSAPWRKEEIKQLTGHLKQDLECDGNLHKMRAGMDGHLLKVEFAWK